MADVLLDGRPVVVNVRVLRLACRDGAAGYADAVYQALPDALQVGDR